MVNNCNKISDYFYRSTKSIKMECRNSTNKLIKQGKWDSENEENDTEEEAVFNFISFIQRGNDHSSIIFQTIIPKV